MEELEKYIDQLNDLSLQLSCISGLFCILKDAMQQIDIVEQPQYANGCFYLNYLLSETEASFQQVRQELFSTFCRLKSALNHQRLLRFLEEASFLIPYKTEFVSVRLFLPDTAPHGLCRAAICASLPAKKQHPHSMYTAAGHPEDSVSSS